jgi:hypothetical protein
MYSVETRSAFLLALLELARLGEVWVFQPVPFAPVWIQRPARSSLHDHTPSEQGSAAIMSTTAAEPTLAGGGGS